jgi:curved DNA-binding protein CbpA
MQLPEDLTRWPDDPYALLGVAQDIGARDLRRAYTRLIKVYKPEHAPDEFRKLREAYETISQHLQWRERYGIHIDSESPESEARPAITNATPAENSESSPRTSDEADSDAAETNGADSHPASISRQAAGDQDRSGKNADGEDTSGKDTGSKGRTRQPVSRPARSVVTDPLRDAWQLAIDGSTERAFAELKKFAVQHGMTPPVVMRLYWLLVTFPELDPQVQPAGILARGLLNDGWDSSLVELYRRELVDRPAEAESQRCEKLLATAPPYLLCEWLPLRWRAALKQNRWEMLQQDLVRFQPVVLASSEHQWAGLLFEALDQLAWQQHSAAEALFEKCRAELESLTHLQLPLSGSFDRADLLCELKDNYQNLLLDESIPSALKALLAECWDSPYELLRPKLAQLAQWLSQQPETGLKCLDKVHRIAKSLLGHLDDTLRRYAYSEGADFDLEPESDWLGDLLATFLARHKVGHYRDLRQPLLAFCHRHGVLCEEIVAHASPLLENFRLGNDELLLAKLTEDLPLRCVCHAQRAYYG